MQVFLQRRVAGMAFAGGMTVFPGGGVARRTGPPRPSWDGPAPAWWAERLACDAGARGPLVRAAVRETFEECGVLLAGPGARRRPSATRSSSGRRTLDEVLTDAGLSLRADLLRPWARWVTPEAAPRRYDTAFFVARCPRDRRPTRARPRPSRPPGGARPTRWRRRARRAVR